MLDMRLAENEEFTQAEIEKRILTKYLTLEDQD